MVDAKNEFKVNLPRVLISILNWNNWSSTVKAVQSVQNSGYRNFEIVVIDNNSQDDSLAKFKIAIPSINVWALNKNLGYAGAHEKAAKIALENNYDLLWILNNDIEVTPSTLGELVNAYSNNRTAIFGSVSLQEDGKTIRFGGGAEVLDIYDPNIEYNKYQGLNYFDLELTERPVSDIEGASMMIPVDIIRSYGFLDTKFFLYGEETDYCYKLRRNYNIQSFIVPKSIIIHRTSESFTLSSKLPFVKTYYTTRNLNILYKKYFNNFTIHCPGGFKHLLKFFFKHYFIINNTKKDEAYWARYYYKLGCLHALIRLKGKYLEPNNFLE